MNESVVSVALMLRARSLHQAASTGDKKLVSAAGAFRLGARERDGASRVVYAVAPALPLTHD